MMVMKRNQVLQDADKSKSPGVSKVPDLALALDKGPRMKRPSLDGDDEAMEEEMEGESHPPDIETTPELEDAAGAVSAALASGDNAEIAKTLKGFFQLCGDY